jgi:hypothetical protein
MEQQIQVVVEVEVMEQILDQQVLLVLKKLASVARV